MQLAPTTAPATVTSAIAPGMMIATGADSISGAPVDVIAGRVLRTGVRDIPETGWALIRSTHDPVGAEAWGAVAFLRTGDAWTAVELLTRTPEKTEPLWLTSHVRDVRIASDVQIDALWQVSHFGGDYTAQARQQGWISPTA